MVLAIGMIREGIVPARVLSCEIETSGLLSAAEDAGTGAVAARRMKGEGRSGSSMVHLAGVAASR